MSLRTAILGSGGHARSVAGVAIESLGYSVVAFFDVHSDETPSETIYGIAVLPGKTNLHSRLVALGVDSVILSIGDNTERAALYEKLKGHFRFPNIVAPSAIVKKSVVMGEANIILEQVYIGPDTKMGDNNLFNTRALIEHECSLGSSNHFAPACVLLGRVSLGDFNFFGAGSTLKQGVHVSSHVVVGANSFVSREITERGTYVGAPAISKGTR